MNSETGLIIGAHIIGQQAASLIQPLVQAMEFDQPAADVAARRVLHPPGVDRSGGERAPRSGRPAPVTAHSTAEPLELTDAEIEHARAITPGCVGGPAPHPPEPRRLFAAAARGGRGAGRVPAARGDSKVDTRSPPNPPTSRTRSTHRSAVSSAPSAPRDRPVRARDGSLECGVLVRADGGRANASSSTTTNTARTRSPSCGRPTTKGVTVERVPSDESGQVSVDAMAAALDRRRRRARVAHPRADQRRSRQSRPPRSVR